MNSLCPHIHRSRSVPVVASAGNADIDDWKNYQAVTQKHNNVTETEEYGEFRCNGMQILFLTLTMLGIVGVQSYCAVKGMLIAQIVTEPQIRRAAEINGFSITNNQQFIENAYR